MHTNDGTQRGPLVPLEEVLDYTGLTASSFYSLRHRGQGPPAYRIGRRLMFRWNEVEAWIDSRHDTVRPI
jgi:predicted DNA-binding transcriptional regulator AlpA